MNFHDAVLDTVTLSASRDLVIVLSEIPGYGPGAKVSVRVRDTSLVVMSGVIREDWFLGGVYFWSPAGETLDVAQTPQAALGRLVVQGTDGAFIEVVGGEMNVQVLVEEAS